MATAVVVLYFLPYILNEGVSQSVLVNPAVLVLAAVTAVTSFTFYLWVPKNLLSASAVIIYLLLSATNATLVMTTGGLASPFIALWMLVSLFVGVFGLFGLVPMLVALGAFVAEEYLADRFTPELLVVVVFAGLLPVIASFIIWHNRSGKVEPEAGDKAYKDLASELTQVSTQSEVVINAIGDGVMAVDGKGVIQLINPAGQALLGWGKQDAMGLNYKSVLRLTDQKGAVLDPTVDPVQQVLNTNQEARNDDLITLSKSDKKIMVSLVISPIGEMGSGAIIVFRDVTKAKAEEREQAEFISTASHEMRTPVASIEGYMGLALNPQTAQIDDRARGFIMKAHEAAQHLGRLFQDLLDISKADDRRLTNNPKVTDIVAFTREVMEGLLPKANEKGIKLVFKPSPEDGGKHIAPVYYINQDNDHIREILDNLIENGIKYTLQGEVVIDITGSDDRVVISIKDTGIGIPSEDIPHLFQKFYRVNNTETNQIGGTGLGLYLCRKLAEAMSGRVWAESEYKKGSTFYLELPRISTQEAEQLRVQQQAAAAVQPVAEIVAPTPPALPTAPPATTSATQVAAPVAPVPATVLSEGESNSAVKPATTVPRGESLTPEQIAAQVAKLKALAAQQTADNQTTNGGGQ